MALIWLQRTALVLVVALLGWQVWVQGTGRMASERLAAIYAGWAEPWTDGIDSIPPDADLALTADAWTSLADQALVRTDLAKAETYAWRALNQNITSGRPAARLLNIRDIQGKQDEADQLAELTARLWPMHPDALLRISAHWITRQDIEKTLQALDALMAQTSAYNAQLFPPLHELARHEEAAPLLKQYAASAPSWWPSFFSYLAQHEEHTRLIAEYYRARGQADKPLTKGEQLTYINRLIKEKQWQQARAEWLGSLDNPQQPSDTLLYDGGFESGVTNEGFAWHLHSNKQVKLETVATYGITGKKALRITFRGRDKPLNFRQVWQRLILEPGDYQLSLRHRLDHFSASKGLQWRLRCEGNQELLMESPPLHGYGNWETQTAAFTVPSQITESNNPDRDATGLDGVTECNSQILRLEAASRFAHEQLFTGTLWFDDIIIKPWTKE